MKEPHLSEFRELIRSGAATQDIFDSTGQPAFDATNYKANDGSIQREIDRVALHQSSLCPILEQFVGPVKSVLDVGCSSGGTTVAMALSPFAEQADIIGVDPNVRALKAARVRAKGYDLAPGRVQFLPIKPGEPLPFEDGRFDLIICASVIEFISSADARRYLAQEILRVTRAGGFAYITLPNPYRLQEFHTRRFLGDFVRREGCPWSNPPRQMRQMFKGSRPVPIGDFLLAKARSRVGNWLPRWTAPVLPHFANWQKMLFRKYT